MSNIHELAVAYEKYPAMNENPLKEKGSNQSELSTFDLTKWRI